MINNDDDNNDNYYYGYYYDDVIMLNFVFFSFSLCVIIWNLSQNSRFRNNDVETNVETKRNPMFENIENKFLNDGFFSTTVIKMETNSVDDSVFPLLMHTSIEL